MVWFRSMRLQVNGLYNMSLMAWITQLAQQVSSHSFDLVLMSLWGIWKARNDLLWNGSKRGGYGVVCRNCSGGFLGAMIGGNEVVASTLQAELVAARRAVLFMQENFATASQVIFEGNSSLTLATMKNMGDETSNLGPLINDIRIF
ncbi:hypothetical protein TB1_046000 [Malus domestica]